MYLVFSVVIKKYISSDSLDQLKLVSMKPLIICMNASRKILKFNCFSHTGLSPSKVTSDYSSLSWHSRCLEVI